MESVKTLAMVLIPMCLGFCVSLPKCYWRVLDRVLSGLVYIILLLIGMGLAQVENLWGQLNNIVVYVLVLFGLLMVFNLAALAVWDSLVPWKLTGLQRRKKQSIRWWQSLKQPAVALFGLLLGLMLPERYLPPDGLSTYAVMLLILLVGIQLRSHGIKLLQVLLNKRGMQMSVLFIVSCLLAGLVFASLFDEVSWGKGLALSSGYGWYSLSGIMMTKVYGATWGSVALLNDLLREFFALAFIPLLMRKTPSAAIGVGGATSMDFTLPVIQSSGGLEVVAPAISFGVVVNVLSPLLMWAFSVGG